MKYLTSSRRNLPNFAGIALADILANGVAVIILMIIVNLSIQRHNENKKAEKAKELALILSRDRASSVVMNALPTSPPARLHHYTKSHIDLYPQHRDMPILQLYRDSVRNFYTDEAWKRDTLLYPNNKLDHYIKSLSYRQKENIRIDVHSIKNFYIVMSILKDYNINIRHWHFNGEGFIGDEGFAVKNKARLKNNDRVYKNGIYNDNQKKLPEGVTLSQYTAIKQKNRIDINENKGSRDLQQSENENTTNANANANGYALAGKQFKSSQLILSKPVESENSYSEKLRYMDYKNFIAYIFEIMSRIQKKSDLGDYSILANLSIKESLYDYIYSFPKISKFRAYLIEKVANQTLFDVDSQIKVVRNISDKPASIRVYGNKITDVIYIDGNSIEGANKENVDVSFHMRLYPAAYEGVRRSITLGSIFLIEKEELDDEEFKWRIVTFLDGQSKQSHLGFIYSAIVGEHLVIAGDENAVIVNGQPIYANITVDMSRHEKILLILYTLLVLIILSISIVLFRR